MTTQDNCEHRHLLLVCSSHVRIHFNEMNLSPVTKVDKRMFNMVGQPRVFSMKIDFDLQSLKANGASAPLAASESKPKPNRSNKFQPSWVETCVTKTQ